MRLKSLTGMGGGCGTLKMSVGCAALVSSLLSIITGVTLRIATTAPTAAQEWMVMQMPKNKGIYRIFRTKEEMQAYDENLRHFSRVFMLDHVSVALGRMGFRETKFREFDRILTEVMAEYMEDYKSDLKDDKTMEYSRACLDRELKQYTGSLFVPEEERYR